MALFLTVNHRVKVVRNFIRGLSVVCISSVALAQVPTAPDEPVTGTERLAWFAEYTAGPAILLGSAITAAFSTERSAPPEYDTHWKGFGQRYGMQVASVATSNAMEATLGALWGEDPRYFRASAQAGFGSRVGHIVKWTFVAPDRNGDLRPAYARYLAIPGSSFLENTWVVPSDSTTKHALERTALGVLARMAGNTFHEFWPDVKRKVFGH